MVNEYTDIMSQQSDEQLIRIVVVQRDDYNPMAVEAAIAELEKRGVVLDEFEKLEKKVIEEDEKKELINNNSANSSLRIINLLIDTTIVFILAIIVAFIIFPIDRPANNALSYLIGVGVYFLYYAIMEINYKKTVGKFITKTKVVKMNEEEPDNSDIITRTLCRFIPLDKVSFLFTRFGFHDNFSNTKVISDNYGNKQMLTQK